MSWSDLLKNPGGPKGAHDQMLALLLDKIGSPAFAGKDLAIMGADRALGAHATLRGPAACHELADRLEATVKRLGARMARMPAAINDAAAITLVSYTDAVASIGRPIDLVGVDLGQCLDRFVKMKVLSSAERVTVALLSLIHDRGQDVSRLFPKARPGAGGDAPSFLATLAKPDGDVAPAWEAFLVAFPEARRAQPPEVAWEHLLLAARVVYAKRGDTPVAEVGEALHRQVAELAAREGKR
jgi:hypothetical protein